METKISMKQVNDALENGRIDEGTLPQFISASEMQSMEQSQFLDPSPKYQRPYRKQDGKKGYWGDAWQKELIVAFFSGKFIQAIHHRYNPLNQKWEIVDGGHRTRTIINFLKGQLKTPKGFQFDWNGKSYDLGNKTWKEIQALDKDLAFHLINNNYFFVIRHQNMTNNEAKKLFIILNHLNKVTPAEMRNAESAEVADSCRKLGALDESPYEIFNSATDKKMNYISLQAYGRETDAFITALTYMVYMGKNWEEGSNPKWDEMYKNDVFNTEKDKSVFTLNGKIMKEVNIILFHLNSMILEARKHSLKGFGKGYWKTHVMLKYCKFIKWILDNNKNYEVEFDYIKLIRQFQLAVSGITIAHCEYERYDIRNGKVIPLGKAGIDSAVNQPKKVFTGGTRIDDYEFILKHVELEYEPTKFGVTLNTKRGNFKDEDAWAIWAEQNGKCANCGKEIGLDAQDHILSVKGNGLTEKENLQILCEDCNGNKSSGMTYDELDKLLKNKAGRLTTEQMRQISNIIN